ncbi:MAG: DUF1015 domain-containing protein [Gemmataceae bacterium]
MPELHPFRGWRYDLAHVGTLAAVTAPPYDVIDRTVQDQLYSRSPYNIVRVELTRPEPGEDAEAKYARAARWLQQWLKEGVLQQDPHPCLYVYHQVFEHEERRLTRRGFLARVRLYPFEAGIVFPHEATLSGPKEDRLKLMRATGMNISPVFGLYADESGQAQDTLDRIVRAWPPLEVRDDQGVIHRLWAVSQPDAIRAVQRALHAQPVILADGHHRYETSLAYLAEQIAARGGVPEDDPCRFVLMDLVRLQDPGLVILPTHRLIRGIPSLSLHRLRAVLAVHFEIEEIRGEHAAEEAWEWLCSGDQSLLAWGTAEGPWLVTRFRSPTLMEHLAPQHSHAWRSLAVSILHVFVLPQLLGAALGGVPECDYVHRLQDVTDGLRQGACNMAVLVPPLSVHLLQTIAGAGERLPPKTTYFYPKLLTGLVLNSVR